jgi:hypothetical protein
VELVMRAFLSMFLMLALLPFALAAGKPQSAADFAKIIAPQVDPAKLATLRARGANPRICRITYWLESARRAGADAAVVANQALAMVGMTGDSAALTREALIRNLTIAERLGCWMTPEWKISGKDSLPRSDEDPMPGRS